MNNCVFIDRDGTLIVEKDFLQNPDDVEFIDGSIEAVKLFNDMGFKVIIVSNQSGVARGYFTENEVQIVNMRVQEIVEKEGAHIDDMYYCPHHPDGVVPEYSLHCDCRKPKPGMVYKAVENHDIDLETSYVIGDKESDVLLGKLAGVTAIRVRTGYGKDLGSSGILTRADHVAENLLEAAKWIKKRVNPK
ncbi:HAD family hydrolase [bacterium]|nr:HAD family hydrolase [bacterium]